MDKTKGYVVRRDGTIEPRDVGADGNVVGWNPKSDMAFSYVKADVEAVAGHIRAASGVKRE